MKGTMYSGQIDAFKKIWAADRLPGFYRGWLANTLKVTPQNSIRWICWAWTHRGNVLGPPYSYNMCRVGQNHIYSVYIRYFWQGFHQMYGHIRRIYMVLANPIHLQSESIVWGWCQCVVLFTPLAGNGAFAHLWSESIVWGCCQCVVLSRPLAGNGAYAHLLSESIVWGWCQCEVQSVP